MSKAKITVKLLSACNYDHDRIGTVIVGEEALDFRLERSGNLLVSNDSNRFVNIKKMGLPKEIQIKIKDTIKLDMAEEEYLAP
ncbi:hypothetical protein [uncultured Gemmiger sp.]|jgi:hypothetical protein|uniref:hypothetical protein n=1 Tax=uncultured Gemmiger sp. TaxID=1623490 RepID=UPI0025ED4CE4|nr:hypothetical protein [uncultured Gemmiger sp.]